MEVRSFLKRISSRKFIIALAGIAVGMATAFGITESEWASIAGAVTAMASVVSFIIGEAKIDAAGAEGASIKGLIDEAEAKAGADEKDAEKEEGGV